MRLEESPPAASPDEKLREALDDLYGRPGFLMRRAHQISVALFLEETAALGITATQYGVLAILQASSALDQMGVARLIGIDRSTTAMVVEKLEAAGHLARRRDPRDRRRQLLEITTEGRRVFELTVAPAQCAVERALAVFTPAEGRQFLTLLHKFVGAFNEETRAPIVGRGS